MSLGGGALGHFGVCGAARTADVGTESKGPETHWRHAVPHAHHATPHPYHNHQLMCTSPGCWPRWTTRPATSGGQVCIVKKFGGPCTKWAKNLKGGDQDRKLRRKADFKGPKFIVRSGARSDWRDGLAEKSSKAGRDTKQTLTKIPCMTEDPAPGKKTGRA